MSSYTDYGIDTRGRTAGEVKTLCPRCSALRTKSREPCLNVNLDRGVWRCWNCDWRGSLDMPTNGKPAASPSKPVRKPQWTRGVLLPEGMAWLHGRGITDEVIERHRLGYERERYFGQLSRKSPAIQFPYYRGAELVNVKYRAIPEKAFGQEANAAHVLYGLNDVQGDTLLICEGELDKLACEVAGFPNCVSVPNGAPGVDDSSVEGKLACFNHHSTVDLLKPVKHIILAVDNDAPGKRLADEIARRMGPERCYLAEWSSECKDANDVLMSYGPEVLRECLTNAQPYPVKGIVYPRSLKEATLALYHKGQPKGISTGWPRLDEFYTIKPGEFTVITGIPSHGKSSLMSALAVQLAVASGWKFGLFAAEQLPLEQYLAMLSQVYTGAPFFDGPTRRMAETELLASINWLDEHIAFLMPEDDAPPTIHHLLDDLAKVELMRRGIEGLVIDPYNELDHTRPASMTGTEYISAFLSKIRRFARLHRVHVWIVAHPTKLKKEEGAKELPVPKAYDIEGSAHWYNKADNILSVWRDVKADNNIVEVHVQKVRFRWQGKPGVVRLYYHDATGRFSEPY